MLGVPSAPAAVPIPRGHKVGQNFPDWVGQNYPNPFNPETWIPYRLAKDASVIVTIYDATGQVVRIINVGYKQTGIYDLKDRAIYWDGRNNSGERVSSGVYFYHFRAGDYSETRKMIILK